jgi:mono/diheme cytochrome c family protein
LRKEGYGVNEMPRLCSLSIALMVAACSVGCGGDPLAFRANRLAAKVLERENGTPMQDASEDTLAIVEALFGTPDVPHLPPESLLGPQLAESLEEMLDLENLSRAAGPIFSDQQDVQFGLYRKHCINCHGLEGNGRGAAAALQNPYPRDFTAGVYKYKSTPRGSKPTRQDLLRTLQHGLTGSSMPAFGLLADENLESLVDYVIYLSMRGETERRLLAIAASDLEYEDASGERWLSAEEITRARPETTSPQIQWIADEIKDVIERWQAAEQNVPKVAVPEMVANFAVGKMDPGVSESISEGKLLFQGQIANCASCHGMEGNGSAGLPPDYDDWTKFWTTKLGIDPADKEKLTEFYAAGALKPKSLASRNLQHGGFRGGQKPEDVYLRILHGIDGTPMPAVNLVKEPSGTGLTESQIWQLVTYVLSLSPAKSSTPANAGAIQ